MSRSCYLFIGAKAFYQLNPKKMFSLIILNYIEALRFGFPVDTVCKEGHGLNLENTVEALDPQPAIMVNK